MGSSSGCFCDPSHKVAARFRRAQYALAPRSRVYLVPDDIDDAPACQFALNPLTAWGLLDVAAIAPRGRVLLTAGTSTVARLVAALAHQRGLATSLLARGDGVGSSHGYRAWSAAAPESVVFAPDLADALAAIDDGRGFDVVIDPVGGPATIELIGACAPGATMVCYGVLDDRAFKLRASTLVYRNLRLIGFGIDRYLDGIAADALRAASAALWQLMRSQPALLAPARRHALYDFAEAIAGMADVKHGKTLLIGPAEDPVTPNSTAQSSSFDDLLEDRR